MGPGTHGMFLLEQGGAGVCEGMLVGMSPWMPPTGTLTLGGDLHWGLGHSDTHLRGPGLEAGNYTT